MPFDLARALLRKQERETARLLDFSFRHRARTARLIAEWVRERRPDGTIDPIAAAAWTVELSDDEVRARLRAMLPADICTGREWIKLCERLSAAAWAELADELGDPTPHRLS